MRLINTGRGRGLELFSRPYTDEIDDVGGRTSACIHGPAVVERRAHQYHLGGVYVDPEAAGQVRRWKRRSARGGVGDSSGELDQIVLTGIHTNIWKRNDLIARDKRLGGGGGLQKKNLHRRRGRPSGEQDYEVVGVRRGHG